MASTLQIMFSKVLFMHQQTKNRLKDQSWDLRINIKIVKIKIHLYYSSRPTSLKQKQ